MQTTPHRPTWKTLLAFAIIYFVWGSTYLAIRVGVREVPPFLLAAMRFLAAGVVLYGWTIARGERSPSGRQWISASILAVLIFVLDYGLLFWAEQRVPSGIAAVMMATIPVFMALSEIVILRTQRLTAPPGPGALDRDWRSGGADEPFAEPRRGAHRHSGAVALMVASLSWSISSALTRKLPLAVFQSHELGSADARRREYS